MYKSLIIAIFTILLLILPPQAEATDLRGRIDGQHAYSPYSFPVSGVKVDLYLWIGRWETIYTTFSGSDGLYYMQNIRPGNYYLQVNGINYPLSVLNVPYQDIPPILIRYLRKRNNIN